ncbi:type IIL restriction-modification enzyme MmeI [Methylotuvimicrobium buryatense]|uniref:MmeI-like target recognition domain-containing protein n=1 Tax=Methylotuvimicrobium buryatense TaxID=95641 RepID=A0A4P9UIS5_METBY|nr:type IIL restriction-modification enzyme MmeI [Methylotuvimicrobium buryatense]QCW81039.1 hypothetical protein EQU24_01310 [Methylotuvimicrobium buryatense]
MDDVNSEPKPLLKNQSICYKGSELLGDFFISKETARSCIKEEEKYSVVFKPILGGKELTSTSIIKPERWVIFLSDLPLARAESEFHTATEILKERFSQPDAKRPRRKNWWQFHRPRVKLYDGMKNLSRVLIRPYTSNMSWFEFGSIDWLYTNAVVVVLLDDYCSWGVLNSTIHEEYAANFATRMKTDIRYIPSTCFETFPLIFEKNSDKVLKISKDYHQFRISTMKELDNGLTSIYQSFHNPNCNIPAIEKMREMHIQLDLAVCEMYSIPVTEINHNFNLTKQGIRFTISEENRSLIITRLLNLNKLQNELESTNGSQLKDKKITARAKHPSTSKSFYQTELVFEDQNDNQILEPTSVKVGNQWGKIASDQMLAWLEAHKGWFNKSAILNGCGADPNEWAFAIDELLKDEYVESQGESDAIRYRAKP